MKEIVSKSGLAIALSRLNCFEKPKVRAEQYTTDSEIAAEVVWNSKMLGDAEKVIADLGCGAGVLGIGALLLGAKKVFFVDNDEEALNAAKFNLEKIKAEFYIGGDAIFLCKDIIDFEEKTDVVVENPPFGTKEKHADRIFLQKAIKIAPIIYTFHKTSTKQFVGAFARDNDYDITHCWDFDFPLKATYAFHRRRIKRIEVSCFRLKSKII